MNQKKASYGRWQGFLHIIQYSSWAMGTKFIRIIIIDLVDAKI